MSGIQIADAKAPFVMFERKAVEDRAASIEQGHYVARDVDYVLITPHGSRDQIERVVRDWLESMEQQAREGRLDKAWFKSYKAAYDDWKEGRETPLEGTPISNWPVVSPAQVEMLRGLKVLTVEVLSNANEELIKRMGMGGRILVDKARDFIATSKNQGKVVEEIGALRGQVSSLTKSVEQLSEMNRQLQIELNVYRTQGPQSPPTVMQGNPVTTNDLFDEDKPAKRRL